MQIAMEKKKLPVGVSWVFAVKKLRQKFYATGPWCEKIHNNESLLKNRTLDLSNNSQEYTPYEVGAELDILLHRPMECSFPITKLPPPLSRENIPPVSGIWLPLAITKITLFPGFHGKSSRDDAPQIPPFPPRKWEHASSPLIIMHSSGGGKNKNKERNRHTQNTKKLNIKKRSPYYKLNGSECIQVECEQLIFYLFIFIQNWQSKDVTQKLRTETEQSAKKRLS